MTIDNLCVLIPKSFISNQKGIDMSITTSKGKPTLLVASAMVLFFHLAVLSLCLAKGLISEKFAMPFTGWRTSVLFEPFLLFPVYAVFFWLYFSERKSMVRNLRFLPHVWRRKKANRYNSVMFFVGIMASLGSAWLMKVLVGPTDPWILAVTFSLVIVFFLIHFFKRAFGLLFLVALVMMASDTPRTVAYGISGAIAACWALYGTFLAIKAEVRKKRKKSRIRRHSSR